jgi:hypothetical protein
MDGVTAAGLAALVWKIMAVIKNAVHATWDPVLTQVLAWVIGVALVALAAHANISSGVVIWGSTLGCLDGWSIVLLGVSISSLGGAAVEVKKAIDNQDTAKQPSLLND